MLFDNNWAKYLFLFALLMFIVYLIALSVVTVVDQKIGEVKIQMPKIEIKRESFENGKGNNNNDGKIENVDNEMAKLDEIIALKTISARPLTRRNREIPDKLFMGEPKTKIGCKTDADCNVVNGGGKNVCKSNGKCYCLSGSGLFCQYGPTNYQDPKDMTEEEREIFKYKYRNDFTLQDYKNWLMLYKDDPQHLRHHHRENLKILLRGGTLTEKDLPAISIKPPMDPADYFQKMYEGGKISVHFPEESATGAMLGYNYGEYGEFIPPEKEEESWITGVVDLYRQPQKDNAKALNSYLRPDATVGIERELVGDEYLKEVKRHQNISDIRKIKERQAVNESLNTFESSDQNVSIDPSRQLS